MSEFNSPPVVSDRRATDEDHLRLLWIFHYVGAGFALMMILVGVMEWKIFSVIFSDPSIWPSHDPNPFPQFLDFFRIILVVMGVYYVVRAVMNILSAIFLYQRKNRLFSFITAVLNCLDIPLGTILGVFTIIVLSRESVIEMYQQNRVA